MVAENLSHLPPALIVTAANDPLRDMGKAYADRLANAGSEVEYWCIEGMIHNFLGHTGKSTAARGAFLRIAHFIAERFDVGVRADTDVK
jgi:acetyl esterase